VNSQIKLLENMVKELEFRRNENNNVSSSYSLIITKIKVIEVSMQKDHSKTSRFVINRSPHGNKKHRDIVFMNQYLINQAKGYHVQFCLFIKTSSQFSVVNLNTLVREMITSDLNDRDYSLSNREFSN